MTELNLTGGEALAALASAVGIVLAGIYKACTLLRGDIREMKTDFKDRMDEMRTENRDAHAGITENIHRMERRQDKGFDRLYTLFAAITPRAAAEQPRHDGENR